MKNISKNVAIKKYRVDLMKVDDFENNERKKSVDGKNFEN